MFIRLAFFLLLFSATQVCAQEEFILGKSANSLPQGFTIISAEYSAFAFENIKAKRAGLDIAYGLSNRFSLFLRGSISDFPGGSSGFETGTLSVLYKIIDINTNGNKWAIASFAQAAVLSNTAQIPQDISFDGNNSGYSLGLVVNRNTEFLTLAGTMAYAKLTIPKFVDGLLDGYGLLYQLSANKELNAFANPGELKVNFIAELSGQYNSAIIAENNNIFAPGSYLDLLGGLQFTAADQYRVELALQKQLSGNVLRFSEGLYHIRLKYML